MHLRRLLAARRRRTSLRSRVVSSLSEGLSAPARWWRPADTRATVWHSGDGRSWELLPPQSAFDHGQMLSVAANQNLIVAVGFRSLPPTTPGADEISPGTWWSSDGRNWHLAQGSPRFYSVTERAGTFLAVTIGNEIWRSSDGQNWTRAATTADLDHSTLRGITSGEFGIIAWGSQSNGAGAKPR